MSNRTGESEAWKMQPRLSKDNTSKVSLFLLCALVLILSQAASFYLSQGSVTVRILDMRNTTPNCGTGFLATGAPALPAGKGGSSTCGDVFTTMGLMAVIPSNSLNPFAMNRADMVATWKVGCRYRLSYYGSGPKPSASLAAPVGQRKIIYASEGLHDCTIRP